MKSSEDWRMNDVGETGKDGKMTQDPYMAADSRSRALALPDEARFRQDFQAITRFQQIVQAQMIEGHDYGVIPGTGGKPTLLKPGAEKIAKLLGLADEYDILDRQEDWDKPFFRYLIRCRLVSVSHGVTISQGLGECNSMEAKYRWRWVGERDLPAGIDKASLVSQERRGKTGGHWRVYRIENEDIYSQVNTLIKMSKKRSLVDAALSAGRLSDLFTQDLEDLGRDADDVEDQASSPRAEHPQGRVVAGSSPSTPTKVPLNTILMDYRPHEARTDIAAHLRPRIGKEWGHPISVGQDKTLSEFFGEDLRLLYTALGLIPNRGTNYGLSLWLKDALQTKGDAAVRVAVSGIIEETRAAQPEGPPVDEMEEA